MDTIDVKSMVADAIRAEWPAFAASHPMLARVLDETLLVEPVIERLRDDPAYQRAMRDAQVLHAGAQQLADLLRAGVKQVMEGL